MVANKIHLYRALEIAGTTLNKKQREKMLREETMVRGFYEGLLARTNETMSPMKMPKNEDTDEDDSSDDDVSPAPKTPTKTPTKKKTGSSTKKETPEMDSSSEEETAPKTGSFNNRKRSSK